MKAWLMSAVDCVRPAADSSCKPGPSDRSSAVDPDDGLQGALHDALHDDIDGDFERLKGAGYRVLGDGPKEGADGKHIFFVHPGDAQGVLTEFCMDAAR